MTREALPELIDRIGDVLSKLGVIKVGIDLDYVGANQLALFS
jgi:hypothetical protein